MRFVGFISQSPHTFLGRNDLIKIKMYVYFVVAIVAERGIVSTFNTSRHNEYTMQRHQRKGDEILFMSSSFIFVFVSFCVYKKQQRLNRYVYHTGCISHAHLSLKTYC